MPYYIRDPKRDHSFDNHRYRPTARRLAGDLISRLIRCRGVPKRTPVLVVQQEIVKRREGICPAMQARRFGGSVSSLGIPLRAPATTPLRGPKRLT